MVDALQKIFQAYDEMLANDPPPWEPVPQEPQPPQPPQPPAEPKPQEKTQAPAPSPSPSDLGYKGKKNWNDVRADKEEKAQQLLEERMRASHANKLLNDRISMPNGGVSYTQDEAGLAKAYNNTTYPGVYYDEGSRTMYVKGTSNAQDWWDDITKIPVWGNLQDSFRYHDSERAYQDLLRRGKPVDRVVGHSLGGSIALQEQEDHNIEWSRTFGAPVFDLNPQKRGTVDRVRHPIDPVSIFDRAATWGPLMAYPHSYYGFEGFDRVPDSHLDHKAVALRARGIAYPGSHARANGMYV